MTELAAVVRFVHLTGAVLAVGGFAFRLLIAEPAFRNAGVDSSAWRVFTRFSSRIIRWSIFIVLLSALLGLWIQVTNVNEASGAALDLSAVTPLLFDTLYGRVWLARMSAVAILTSLLLFGGKKVIDGDSVFLCSAGFVLSAFVLASISLSGHAAAAEGWLLVTQVSADALHLLAAGLWLGALLPLFACLGAGNQTVDGRARVIIEEATRRFSRLGVASVAVLLITGSYNAWVLVGGFPPLFGTPYGRLLLIKLGLLLPLLWLAAMNLLKLKPRIVARSLDDPKEISRAVRTLSRNVILEASVGLALLFIVGAMGVTPPARHVQPDWPFSFRWNWAGVTNAPKARAEVERGLAWGAVGMITLAAALIRRRRRKLSVSIAIAVLVYAGIAILTPVSTDAYPTTYRRPAVMYHAISVANGKDLYEDSCAVCHGVNGYGDGPTAEELNPKPADLTARHANDHTAGDLFWWLSYGVKPTSAMPGFSQSLSEEERWDLINFMRALSSAKRARSLAPIIEDEPWLVAPDFVYGTSGGESKALKDHRGDKIALLVLLDLRDAADRVAQLAAAAEELTAAGVETLVVPHRGEEIDGGGRKRLAIVTEGRHEIVETYSLFARSFGEETAKATPPHVEFLIDKQGYIRARWLAAENDAWRKLEVLLKQAELLRREKPRAPAPEEHVH